MLPNDYANPWYKMKRQPNRGDAISLYSLYLHLYCLQISTNTSTVAVTLDRKLSKIVASNT